MSALGLAPHSDALGALLLMAHFGRSGPATHGSWEYFETCFCGINPIFALEVGEFKRIIESGSNQHM